MEKLPLLKEEIIGCRRCPRLVQHREAVAREKRSAFRHETYWGKPGTGFGDPAARLLIVGLAPAAHGGNRTGRVFTGDGSAAFLMQGLHQFGFASQAHSVSSDDGLVLRDAYILAVIRCVPPDNKPLADEIVNCRSFLLREVDLLPNIRAVLALGKIAMDGYIDAMSSRGSKLSRPKFKHGGEFELPQGLPRLFTSYHPSRQNTQTGRLTQAMFAEVLSSVKHFLPDEQ